MRSSAILPFEKTTNGPTKRSCTVKYLQNYDRSLSNHLCNPLIIVRIVTKSIWTPSDFTDAARDMSDLPLPVLSYKYFLLRNSFSILSFYSLKSTFLATALPKNSKNSSKGFPDQYSKSSISLFLGKKWPSTSSFLRSTYHPSFILLLYSCSSANLVTEYFFLLFLFFHPLSL